MSFKSNITALRFSIFGSFTLLMKLLSFNENYFLVFRCFLDESLNKLPSPGTFLLRIDMLNIYDIRNSFLKLQKYFEFVSQEAQQFCNGQLKLIFLVIILNENYLHSAYTIKNLHVTRFITSGMGSILHVIHLSALQDKPCTSIL